MDHFVSNTEFARRINAGIGRLCPCGRRPKLPEPQGQEYITVCLACMGVNIEPGNLPVKYQQANIRPRRRSPRGHTPNITKGPRAAVRAAHFRVNFERLWAPNDHNVGPNR